MVGDICGYSLILGDFNGLEILGILCHHCIPGDGKRVTQL